MLLNTYFQIKRQNKILISLDFLYFEFIYLRMWANTISNAIANAEESNPIWRLFFDEYRRKVSASIVCLLQLRLLATLWKYHTIIRKLNMLVIELFWTQFVILYLCYLTSFLKISLKICLILSISVNKYFFKMKFLQYLLFC